MVKLEAKDTQFGGIFYFHNMEDCNEFLYVFKDHWCNVSWEDPLVIPDDSNISQEDGKEMDVSPKKRAEENLSWGFNLVRDKDIGLTKVQRFFVELFADG